MGKTTAIYFVIILAISISGIFYLNQKLTRNVLGQKILPQNIQTSISPPDPPPVLQPEDIPADPDPFRKSKESIKNADKTQTTSSDKSGRNPFLWTGEKGSALHQKQTSESVPDEIVEPEYNFDLSMILEKKSSKVALINNQFVKEGSLVSGFTVNRIESGYVMLSKGEIHEMIWLPNQDTPLQKQSTTQKVLSGGDIPALSGGGEKIKDKGNGEENRIDVMIQDFLNRYQKPEEKSLHLNQNN